MRLFEIINLIENASAGSTGSGAVATVAMPLGQVQKRIPDGSLFLAKYTTDATPNTPAEYKKYKRKK
jgi:hypothetical protein